MIGRETIDRIRARTDLVAIVGESVKLTRRGRSHLGLCPFHQEKTPSFTVSDERGLFYCFGCKASGDAFKFLQMIDGLTFGEALRKLAERAGIELVDDRSDHDRAEEARARKAKDDLYALNTLAAGYFERMLVEHPLGRYGRDELAKRGLPYDGEGGEILRSFRVGYAPHGWDGLTNYLRQQGASPAQAEQLGLVASRSGGGGFYDAFRHRLMVAISDAQGRIVAFSGRALSEPEGVRPEAPRDPPPKYVNSRESSIYSKGATLFGLFQARNAIRTRGEVVVVEGNFDLIAMHARGIGNVVAPLGTAFTTDQGRLLRRHTAAIVLLFDADGAGRKATWMARDVCKEVGIAPRAARLPSGKDPDDFLRARGAAAMADVLRAARALDEVLIDDVCDPVGEGSNLNEKRIALERVRPLLEEQELAIRDVLAKRVAARLGLDPPTIWRLLRGATRPAGPSSIATAERMTGSAHGSAAHGQSFVPPRRDGRDGGETPSEQSEQEGLSRGVVEALLACPEVIDDPAIQESLALVTGDWAFAVVAVRDEMRNARRDNRPIECASLLARLPAAIQEFAAAKLAEPAIEAAYREASQAGKDSRKLAAYVLDETQDERPSPVTARRIIKETGVRLERVVAAARYREIDREIARAEGAGDFDRALALATEKSRLVAMIRSAVADARGEGSMS